jgi:hypothetical protein
VKNKFAKFIFIGFCLFISCKKKNEYVSPVYHFQNHSPHLSYPFVKTASNSNSITVFYYDTLGRIIGAGNQPYAYSSDTVFFDGSPEYLLGRSGLVNFGFQEGYTFAYDSSGYPISSYFNGVSADTCYYQNNNLIIGVNSVGIVDGVPGYEVFLSYYNTRINTLGSYNYGMPYVGKSSSNLPDSSISLNVYTNNLNLSELGNIAPFNRAIYTYTYNSSGYVSSRTTMNYIYSEGDTETQINTTNFTYY